VVFGAQCCGYDCSINFCFNYLMCYSVKLCIDSAVHIVVKLCIDSAVHIVADSQSAFCSC